MNTETSEPKQTYPRIYHMVKDAKGRDLADYIYCKRCFEINKSRIVLGLDTYREIQHHSDRCDYCKPLNIE